MNLQFLKQKDPWLWGQIFRYLLSGFTAFALDFGTTVFCKEILNINEAIAATLGTFIGLIVTYLLSIFWIFDKRRFSNNSILEFIIFAGIGAVGMLLTYWLMTILSERVGIYYMLAKIITTVVITIWNFTAKKLFLFSKKDNEK